MLVIVVNNFPLSNDCCSEMCIKSCDYSDMKKNVAIVKRQVQKPFLFFPVSRGHVIIHVWIEPQLHGNYSLSVIMREHVFQSNY